MRITNTKVLNGIFSGLITVLATIPWQPSYAEFEEPLTFHTLPACVVVNSTMVGNLVAPEMRDIDVIGADLSAQGGSPTGCGVPETAKAVVLNIKADGVSGVGRVLVYPGDESEAPALENFTPGSRGNNAVPVRLCRDVASASVASANIASANGTTICTSDLIVEAATNSAASVRVVLTVVGYYLPTAPGPAGPQGAVGSQGVAGPPGTSGTTGSIGPQGSTGSQGETGPQGVAGSQGPTGTTGSIGPQGSAGSQGDQGDAGPAGPVGGTVYGDGSRSDVTLTTDTNWLNSPNGNLQFTSLTIESGVTLTVPSGAVIRSTDTFTNNGTIIVASGLPATVWPRFSVSLGLQLVAPQTGSDRNGLARPAGELIHVLRPPATAAGNGRGGNGSPRAGGAGGGSIVVRAELGIANAGTIRADGGNGSSGSTAAGSGGGAGGFIILATAGGITNSGTISAAGGNASAAGTGDEDGGGGGGGGGIIHLIGPNADAISGLSVLAGLRGAGSFPFDGSDGGGGGAMSGNGGDGGDGDGIDNSKNGFAGLIFRTVVDDPATLFQ
ncbi:MAG: hypothetical protein V3U84_12010 [Thiotrichaceae bacterium]